MLLSEHSEQSELVKRMRRAGLLVAAVPNGASLSGGRRERARQMAALKREGLSPGVPDLLIFSQPTELDVVSTYERVLVDQLLALSPEARARVVALSGCGPGTGLEMKRSDGGKDPEGSAAQRRWGGWLVQRGWRWSVAHGWRQGLDQLRALGYKVDSGRAPRGD
jgi:hypothetical protein